MLNKRIIPCLLLKNNLLVKTINFNNPSHVSEPIYAIKIFNDYEVDEILILDIMASRPSAVCSDQDTNKLPLELISKISDEACMPVTYGGGIQTTKDMEQLFRAGIEKVSINTQAALDHKLINAAAEEFGSQSIVVSIDVKRTANNDYEVFSNCGQTNLKIDPVIYAQKMVELGAGEILINSIDRDGTMTGYDIPLVKKISSSVKVPVIASGGAGSTNDFKKVLNQGGASAAAAGSLFVYFGKKRAVLINYPDRSDIEKILEDKD
jgi:imidazole glycerol-phosphate synthase subunit HisF